MGSLALRQTAVANTGPNGRRCAGRVGDCSDYKSQQTIAIGALFYEPINRLTRDTISQDSILEWI